MHPCCARSCLSANAISPPQSRVRGHGCVRGADQALWLQPAVPDAGLPQRVVRGHPRVLRPAVCPASPPAESAPSTYVVAMCRCYFTFSGDGIFSGVQMVSGNGSARSACIQSLQHICWYRPQLLGRDDQCTFLRQIFFKVLRHFESVSGAIFGTFLRADLVPNRHF